MIKNRQIKHFFLLTIIYLFVGTASGKDEPLNKIKIFSATLAKGEHVFIGYTGRPKYSDTFPIEAYCLKNDKKVPWESANVEIWAEEYEGKIVLEVVSHVNKIRPVVNKTKTTFKYKIATPKFGPAKKSKADDVTIWEYRMNGVPDQTLTVYKSLKSDDIKKSVVICNQFVLWEWFFSDIARFDKVVDAVGK